jgi:hypothetical protein
VSAIERNDPMQPYICTTPAQVPGLEELIQKAKKFVAAAKSPATLKAYRNDWRDFEAWCHLHNLPSLPSTPETIALYIADQASTRAVGTITHRLTSITKAHQAAGLKESPASSRNFIVGETLKGIRRVLGTHQPGKEPAPGRRYSQDCSGGSGQPAGSSRCSVGPRRFCRRVSPLRACPDFRL